MEWLIKTFAKHIRCMVFNFLSIPKQMNKQNTKTQTLQQTQICIIYCVGWFKSPSFHILIMLYQTLGLGSRFYWFVLVPARFRLSHQYTEATLRLNQLRRLVGFVLLLVDLVLSVNVSGAKV